MVIEELISVGCGCKHGERGKHTICGNCMRESQIEAKRRKNKWRGN